MTLHPFLERIRDAELVARTGTITRVLPTHFEANGPDLPIGALCTVIGARSNGRQDELMAEVVGVAESGVKLAPLESGRFAQFGSRVVGASSDDRLPVGDAYQGRAVDALGRAIDDGPSIVSAARRPRRAPPLSPLDRLAASDPMATGVRAIDGLLTLGRGQRVGVFAASGVGKTRLVTQLANQAGADHCVICLVGERGREIEALWSAELKPEVKARTTLVAAASDESAAQRVRAADLALGLCEHWRAKGRHVLLILDSVTRLAMAMRELGLAAGEPPTLRAYPPSVFASIPRLAERCGALKGAGSITAVMTILSENDDVDDPICEMMKSVLDGHIVLSRALAESGHFPAIDVPQSLSRLATGLRDRAHNANARAAIRHLSVYEAARPLIEAGLYKSGADAEIDAAVSKRPSLLAYLRQGEDDATTFDEAASALAVAVGSA